MAPAASGGGLTMDVREKLVELLGNIYLPMMAGSDTIGEYNIPHKFKREIADYLISHGVTVQELDGCKYCKEYEDLPEHFIDGKSVGRVFDTCIQPNENGLWHLEVPYGADIGIRFCPMCGRELPQPPKGE